MSCALPTKSASELFGVREPAISRATRSIVPSPPKTNNSSTLRARVAVSGKTLAGNSASFAVMASQ